MVKYTQLMEQTAMNLLPLLLLVSVVVAAPPYPFLDPSLGWHQRVDDLVTRLTLEEIVPQTLTDAGATAATPAIPRLSIRPYVWDTECNRGQVDTNTTAFPQDIGLAATWNRYILSRVGEYVGTEVRAHWNEHRWRGEYVFHNGLSCFTPVINIARHPLWGRNQETYGECPFLTGSLVESFVSGLQMNHPRYVMVNAGCKHFDVHGGPENIPVDRMSFDAKVLTRDWRMTFLPQFRACVRAGSLSLMCSYNRINGVPACANKELLTDITRGEWDFKGYIVSDAGAIQHIMTEHHYTDTINDTVAVAIKAGCNLQLGKGFYNMTLDAVKAGKLSEAEVRENVKPLFYTRMRLGEFDPEDMNPYNKYNHNKIQNPVHQLMALSAAQQSFVLLKNYNNVLPLRKPVKTLVLVGPMVNNKEQMFGDYASNIVDKFTSTPLDSLSKLGETVRYKSGCNDNSCQNYTQSDVVSAVRGAELVVVCLGTGQQLESEGNDRADLSLPGHQLQLLQDAEAAAKGAPVVLILFNGGPLDISYAKNSRHTHAILEAFFPAQTTGEALYRTLTATGDSDSVPAGRLPITWPATMEQVPPMTDYTMEGRTYRYFHGEPLYPFGYGLSYSQFLYRNLDGPDTIKQGESLTLQVTVENLGPYSAQEVVQVYISWPEDVPVRVPQLQLAQFARVDIQVNFKVTLELVVHHERFAVWMDDQTRWHIPTGEYRVYVGGQQPKQSTDVGSNILYTTVNIHNNPGYKLHHRQHTQQPGL